MNAAACLVSVPMVSTGLTPSAAASAKKKLAPPTNTGMPVHANASATSILLAALTSIGMQKIAYASADLKLVPMLLQASLECGTHTLAPAYVPFQQLLKSLLGRTNGSTTKTANGNLFPSLAQLANTGTSLHHSVFALTKNAKRPTYGIQALASANAMKPLSDLKLIWLSKSARATQDTFGIVPIASANFAMSKYALSEVIKSSSGTPTVANASASHGLIAQAASSTTRLAHATFDQVRDLYRNLCF